MHIGQESSLILPMVLDDNGENAVKFEVISTTGKKSYDVDQIIRRYKDEIIAALYANSLVTGQGGGGSMALSESQIKIRDDIIESFLAEIADVFNHYLIPRIFKWNGWEVEEYPKFVHGKVSQPTLDQFAKATYQLLAAGGIRISAKNINHIMHKFDFPDMFAENTSVEDVRAELSGAQTRAGDGFATTGDGTSTSPTGKDSTSSNAHNK